MTILVAYVLRPEGDEALDKGIGIAKRCGGKSRQYCKQI